MLIHGWNPENTTDKYSSSNPEWFSMVTALKAKLAGSDWKLVTYHWEQQGSISPSIGANTGDVWHNFLINDFGGYGNATVAAVHAQQQGVSLSSLLSSQAPGLRKAHFIAHSAGSWAAREAMRLLLNVNPNVVSQMTLLDPFIPDASTLVGTTTGLNSDTMSATAGVTGNSRIARLEDYYAEDIIDQCNTPTISTPGNEFSWRANDINLRVDWGNSGFPGLSLWYDCHSGPVQFYADTIRFVDSVPAYGGLQSPTFDLSNIGWKKSLFYQEQQLRAIITGVSPPTLPASSSSQLITINGSNFKLSGDPNASSLIFYDPANTYPRTPINVTASSMQYNIIVGSATGTWKVKVVNGGVESLPFSFSVSSGSAQLTGLSISGPATVNENTSGQFTAKAVFSDGSNPTVTPTWSVSGPASISASGQLNAGSVNANTTATVSASYTTGGITKTASANVTVVDTDAICAYQFQQIIVNPNFASGGAGWTLTGAFQADSRFLTCKSCPGYAYLANADGSSGNNLSGVLSQIFTIPSNAVEAALTFWDRTTTTESGGSFIDRLNVRLRLSNNSLVGLADIWNSNANAAYTQHSIDLIAYKGQTVTLEFAGTTDISGPTTFRIDDVTLNVTTTIPPTPVALTISGPSSVVEGGTGQYYATMIYCNGTTANVSALTWGNNTPSVVSFTSGGLLTAGLVSQDTVVSIYTTATVNGQNYQAFKDVTVVNQAVTFSSLAISGPSSMNENSSGQFTATAIFSDGTSQTVTPTWSVNSSATSVSSGGSLTTGDVSSDTTVTISASYTTGGITRNASENVLIINVPTPPTLTSVTISGPSSLNENTTAQYYTTAAFSDGTSQNVAPTWGVDSLATSISIFGLLSAGEVAGNTPMSVSASYTSGGITRNAQKNVTVVNVVLTYTLAVSAINGTVTKNPDQASYLSGSQTILTATPAGGYQFDNWSGDASGGVNPLTVTINGNKSITANFTVSPQTGSVQVNLAPANAVSAGARWQVDGGTWQNSGATVSGLSVGNHLVTFNAVAGWITPSNQNVMINANQTVTPTGAYVFVPQVQKQLTDMTLSNGVFSFTLNGPVGSNYVIQLSSNLVNWLPISTNTIPSGGSLGINNSNISNQSSRFYRAIQTTNSPPPMPCVTKPNGLTAWWRFEGNLNDALGTNNGTAVNGATFADGMVEQGLSLAGSNYVTVPSGPALNFTSGFTVEAWIRPNAVSGYTLIATKGEALEDSWLFGTTSNGGLIFRVNKTPDSSVGASTFSPSGLLQIGIETHVAATFDAATHTARIYVNGSAVVANFSVNVNPMVVTSTPLWIGAAKQPSQTIDSFVNGNLDELSLYNRALSASEVQAIFNANNGGKCP